MTEVELTKRMVAYSEMATQLYEEGRKSEAWVNVLACLMCDAAFRGHIDPHLEERTDAA